MSEQRYVIAENFPSGVCLITFNRPEKKNAFLQIGWRHFYQALLHARNDDDIKCIVLTGAGSDFCSGVDLSDLSDDDEKSKFEVMLEALLDFDKPIIAAVKGVAVGFGATILFHCDIVYVGESLRLRLPFVSLGLVPEAACSYTLPTIIGRQAAAELLFTAEWIDANKALQFGLCRAIYKDDELLRNAIDKAEEIAQWPVNALRRTKQCLNAHHREGIEKALVVEFDGMRAQMGSEENLQAIAKFFEKTKK